MFKRRSVWPSSNALTGFWRRSVRSNGFEVLEELNMIGVKQGPYVGDADKMRFAAELPPKLNCEVVANDPGQSAGARPQLEEIPERVHRHRFDAANKIAGLLPRHP
jgi:hypothetical protein